MAYDAIQPQLQRIRKRLKQEPVVIWGTAFGWLVSMVLAMGINETAQWVVLFVGGVIFAYVMSIWMKWEVPVLYCPHCEKTIPAKISWVCGECYHENENVYGRALFGLWNSFVHTCAHCKQGSTGLICPVCGETIVFSERASRPRVARELGWEPSDVQEALAENRTLEGQGERSLDEKLRQRFASEKDLRSSFKRELEALDDQLTRGEIDEEEHKVLVEKLKDVEFQIRTEEEQR